MSLVAKTWRLAPDPSTPNRPPSLVVEILPSLLVALVLYVGFDVISLVYVVSSPSQCKIRS